MQRLGQHFLKNAAVLRKVAEAAAPTAGETVIEIGAGHGELTNELKAQSEKRKTNIIAIEKDEHLVGELRKKFAADTNIEIIEGDALTILPTLVANRKLQTANYKVVGNIPYYITGRLLRVVGELPTLPKRCVFTVQQEVANRILARAPRMNRLAACVQYWADPHILSAISRNMFSPRPHVDSAILVLQTKGSVRTRSDNDRYYRFVRTLFGQPRKTIMNNLTNAGISKESVRALCAASGADPNDRPQNLDPRRIQDIARTLAHSGISY